jgi:hypothetical protein
MLLVSENTSTEIRISNRRASGKNRVNDAGENVHDCRDCALQYGHSITASHV